jgi:hypothetical protein
MHLTVEVLNLAVKKSGNLILRRLPASGSAYGRFLRRYECKAVAVIAEAEVPRAGRAAVLVTTGMSARARPPCSASLVAEASGSSMPTIRGVWTSTAGYRLARSGRGNRLAAEAARALVNSLASRVVGG